MSRSARLCLATMLAMAGALFCQAQEAQKDYLKLFTAASDQRLEDILESADGTRLLTHDRGFAPRLWDPRVMRPLAILGGQTGNITKVDFSLDGKYIVTLSFEEIVVWKSLTADPVAQWKKPSDEGFRVAKLSEDGSWIAIGGSKGSVWSAPTTGDRKLSPLGKHSDRITDLSVGKSEGTVAATSGDGTAQFFTGGKVLKLGKHDGVANWVELSRDEKHVLSTGLDNQAVLYETATGKEKAKFSHFVAPKGMMTNTLMGALFVGQNQEFVIVGGQTGVMSLHKVSDGSLARTIEGSKAALREIRKTRDGLKVATYSDEAALFGAEPLGIWDIQTGKRYPFERQGGPTAGDFSASGTHFWVGYEDGSIAKHNVQTGLVDKRLTSGVSVATSAIPFEGGKRLLIQQRFDAGPFSRMELGNVIDVMQGHMASAIYVLSDPNSFNFEFPWLVIPTKDEEGNDARGVFDFSTGKVRWGFWNEAEDFAWSKNGLIFAHDDENLLLFEMGGPSFVKVLIEKRPGIAWVSASESGKWAGVLTGDLDFELYDVEAGKRTSILKSVDVTFQKQAAFSPDDRHIAAIVNEKLRLVEIPSGNVLWEIDVPQIDIGGGKAPVNNEIMFSRDGKWLSLSGALHRAILRASDGQQVHLAASSTTSHTVVENIFSADGKWTVRFSANELFVHPVGTSELADSLKLVDAISSAVFIPGTKTLLVTNPTDQVQIYEISDQGKLTLKGSVSVMRSGDFLVMDTEGRYDATDPSLVEGASFVKRWSGGLEAIDVSQLKSTFYEPGLLAKLMGLDPEPKRTVPPLDQIRLYPEIDVSESKSKKLTFNISLTERDGGGIGTTRVLINGKLVQEKAGVGAFRIDASTYERFFLPESKLPEGRGNQMRVLVSNARGDLTSPPLDIDLGIPSDLKVPETRLFGLFVGVGDYVGNKKDLNAPPRDAKKLMEAVQMVAGRLLPDRVNLTTITTEETQKPTREAILSWLDKTAKEATSSDIVMVFLAGHGTSRIGEERGYFFLTSDADPSSLDPSIIPVSTVSSQDLTDRLKNVAAGKQVIILDTCHSGAAATDLIQEDRSTGGDYARAYDQLRESTGIWLLAGSAADQLSYESTNVEHGILTYSLLEALDRATPDALRSSESGDLFVDVERWLSYAVQRVDSLKNEVGIAGVQRPQFRRSQASQTFDVGVTRSEFRGSIGLKPPMPILLVGSFDLDEEDPLGLEPAISSELRDSTNLKFWPDIAKHPNAYRASGSYTIEGDVVKLRVALQKFDGVQARKTVETIEITGTKSNVQALAQNLRTVLEQKIQALERK